MIFADIDGVNILTLSSTSTVSKFNPPFFHLGLDFLLAGSFKAFLANLFIP